MSETATVEPVRVADFRLNGSQELCLDLIRICMAQLIVLGHFAALTHSATWLTRLSGLRVAVFFMLSGFLIFATTWRRRHKEFTFRDYMLERSARLWACLIPALIFSAVVAHLVIDLPDYPALHATGPVQFIGNLLMLEDYPLFQILRRIGLSSEHFIAPYASAEPYWTLPIEFWLYVVFGYVFFFGYLRRGRPTLATNALFVVAAGAVVYHAATGYGQCLSLLWLIGALGPWAISADRDLQRRFGYSDSTARLLVLGWIMLSLTMLGLRGLSRGLDFYELQTAAFLAAFLIGLVWLTGRVRIDVAPRFAHAARTVAKQTYALYLTHNAVLTYYIAHTGTDFTIGEGCALVLACNLVAVPFYWLFDRNHKHVAGWLKSLRWPGAPVRVGRQSLG